MGDTEQILSELRQLREDSNTVKTVLLGVPGTEAKGLSHDIQELREDSAIIKNEFRIMNGCVKTNTAYRHAHTWVIGAILTGMGILAYFIVACL